MTGLKNAANDADGRKRHPSRGVQHDERRSKRLRQGPPEPLVTASEGPFARRRVKATRPGSVPSQPAASAGSSESAPLVIDSSGDDEDSVMELAPRSLRKIQPDADVPMPQSDPDTPRPASACQRDGNDDLAYDACFGLVSNNRTWLW